MNLPIRALMDLSSVDAVVVVIVNIFVVVIFVVLVALNPRVVRVL